MIRVVVFVTLACAVTVFAPSHASAQSPNPASIAPGSWIWISALNSRGTISSAPERSPRSGTWRQYCASAVGRDAGSFNDAGNAVDIRIELKITVEEMNELSYL